MKIITKKINEIKPYEKNPRKNDEAVEYVANSIKEFGFKIPIIISKDNIIVAGHTRYKASKKLGLNEVPCIVADDLTDEQIKAFRLADNKVSEFAKWDNEMLEEEIKKLDIDVASFGFVEKMADDMFPEEDETDLMDFFSDEIEREEKEPKKVTCPFCGSEDVTKL